MAILASVLLFVGVIANPSVSLRWSLKEGDTFYAVAKIRQQHTLLVNGKSVESLLKVELTVRYLVKSVKETETIVEAKYLDAVLDSKVLGAAGVAEKVRGATVELVLDSHQSVTRIRGGDALFKRFKEADASEREVAGALFGESGIRETLARPFDVLPRESLAIGATTIRKDEGTVGGLVTKGTSASKLESCADGTARVVVKSDLRIEADKGPGGLADLGAKVDLKSDRAAGAYTFDVEKGRLKQFTHETRIGGTLTRETGDKDIVIGITIDQKQTITITDKNPIRD